MNRGFREVWIDDLTPIMIDAFALYIWATPFITRLLSTVGTTVWWYVATVMVIAMLTFTVNLAAHKHIHWLHSDLRVCESPLFRSVWLFAAMSTVTRHTEGGGVLPFTIVTFLPLVYVRISPLLPPVTALYATGFFVCTILISVTRLGGHNVNAKDTNFSFYESGLDLLSFTISCAHHSIWIASHKHTRSLQHTEYQSQSDTQTDTCTSILGAWVQSEATILATFRMLLVIFSILVGGTPTYSTSVLLEYPLLGLLQTLFLLATISTLAAWTHGQHQQPTCLSNVLLATVVASSCGMLVDGTGQTVCLLAAMPFAIALELMG